MEHEIHQRDDQDRHHQDERDAAVIGSQLTQDSGRGGRVVLRAQPAAGMVVVRRMIDRNASSSDVHPVS
ncbi:hypothetical protein NQU49_27745, partial [Escherichia coli]|nr:hypothetical protein [Escherichia coli]